MKQLMGSCEACGDRGVRREHLDDRILCADCERELRTGRVPPPHDADALYRAVRSADCLVDHQRVGSAKTRGG